MAGVPDAGASSVPEAEATTSTTNPPRERAGGEAEPAQEDGGVASRRSRSECASRVEARPGARFTVARLKLDLPSVQVAYPQLLAGSTPAAGEVNKKVRAFVERHVREFEHDAREGTDGSADFERKCHTFPITCYCEATCVPTFVSPRLVSVACDESCGGGAYPNTGWWTLVLDTSDPAAPRNLRLDDWVGRKDLAPFWHDLRRAVHDNEECVGGHQAWPQQIDLLGGEPSVDLEFFVTSEFLVALAPLPHVALALAECAFPRRSTPWLRQTDAW
jgi:hypothetical protein